MKIAVLNECFLTDTEIKRLKTLGEVTMFSDTDSEEKAIDRLKDIDIAIVDCLIAPINKRVLETTKNLKLLVVNSIGYDLVDVETVNKLGIKIANIPLYATDSVAEQAIALMFAVARKIPLMDKMGREDPGEIDPNDKENLKYLGVNISGKTLGVIGLGRIGTRIAQLGFGLGMKVIGYNRTPKTIEDVTLVSLEKLLQESDVIVVALALVPEVENIIAEKEFNLMKNTAIFVNIARGKHVDQDALYEALKNNKILGAGIDVLADYSKDHPIFTLQNVVFDQKTAFFTKESLNNMGSMVVQDAEAFINKHPINLVN